jgi:futalosine hydrolase
MRSLMESIVLAATNPEISFLLEVPGCRFVEKILGFNVYNVKQNKNNIHIVESGPGLANISAAAALSVERFRPEHIFNVGVCGVYSSDLSLINKVVTGRSAVFADAGVETEKGYQDMEDIGLPFYSKDDGEDVYNIFPLSDGMVDKSFLRGVFLSLSAVSGNAAQAEKIRKRFESKEMLMCEDMETAAVALMACRADIPCTAIRGISNLCGDRNYRNWSLKEAAEAAQKVFLKEICGLDFK